MHARAHGHMLMHVPLPPQVKSLEAELVEAQGFKAACSAADELRGLLEGSKRVGTMKGAENDALPPAFSAATQVCVWEKGGGGGVRLPYCSAFWSQMGAGALFCGRGWMLCLRRLRGPSSLLIGQLFFTVSVRRHV